jgi:hypothetical protein
MGGLLQVLQFCSPGCAPRFFFFNFKPQTLMIWSRLQLATICDMHC